MDDAYVVDTGVFARWYLDQVGFEHARDVQAQFLSGQVALETVDFARVELAEVLRKKAYLPSLLTRQEYLDAVRDLDDLDVVVHPTDTEALERAAALAADRNLRLFDSLFVDRAIIRDVPLLTSDARLCRAVDGRLSTVLLRGI